MLPRVKRLNDAVGGNDKPCGKNGKKETEDREVSKRHYKEIKWNHPKSLKQLLHLSYLYLQMTIMIA